MLGPHGKMDNGAASAVLYTKAELNTLVQKQVSAALKQMSTGDNKMSFDSQKSNQHDQSNKQDDKSKKPKVLHIPKQGWKAKPPNFGETETKEVNGKLGIGVNIVVFGACHMEPKIIRIHQACYKQHLPHHPPPSQTWLNTGFSFVEMSCSLMNDFLARFLCGFFAYFSL